MPSCIYWRQAASGVCCPRIFRPTIPSSTTSASGNMKACLRNWWILSIGWSASWWAGGPPRLGIIDSRSVKSSHHVDTDRGIDGDKRIKGRKEHIVFDTWASYERGGSRGECPWQCRCGWRYWQDEGLLPPIGKDALADGGYKGRKLADTVRQKLGAEFTVVLHPDESPKKFSVLPLRRIVERSFSWLENFRRIAIDHEFYSDTGEAKVQPAFCRLMYNKLCDWNLNSF